MIIRAISLAGMLLLSCISEPTETINTTPPNANFTDMIVIGGAISAGYREDGLFQQGIIDSYPNLLAQQLKSIGLIADFKQPLFPSGQENGTGYNQYYLSQNIISSTPISSNLAIRSTNPIKYTKATGTFNNLAVPQIRMVQLDRNFDNTYFNPFVERLLPQETGNYASLFQSRKVSFFIVELGWHDVLDYALSGGTKPLSNDFAFGVNTQSLMNTFKTQSAKGIVFTIPNIAQLPYFQMVNIESAKKILNATDVYITTASNTVRKAETGDLLLLKAEQAMKDTRSGSTAQQPLSNDLVLDKNEVEQLQNLTNTYNIILKKQTNDYGHIVVDLNTIYTSLTNSQYQTSDAITISGTFPSGGFFSLDGLYPTPRGQAIIANECLKAMRDKYNVNASSLSLKNFSTITIK